MWLPNFYEKATKELEFLFVRDGSTLWYWMRPKTKEFCTTTVTFRHNESVAHVGSVTRLDFQTGLKRSLG